MAALGSEYPNGDVQKGKWLNTTGGTTGNYWELIDEAIASADDTNYVRGTGSGADTSTETYISDLTAMPSDFKSMNSLSYNVRYRQFNRVDDTVGFTILVTNSAGTALTNTVTISNVTTTTFTNSGATAFTLTTAGTTATKTDWDAARLVIGQTYSASMAADGAYIAVSAIELTGDYTAFSTLSRTATSSGTGSSSASRTITKLRTASASGTGSSSASGTTTRLRTGSASGTGSSSSVILATRVRTGSASGVGSSASSGVVTKLRTATSSGSGSSSVSCLVALIRTANSSASGSATATGIASAPQGIQRTASSNGTGSSSAYGIIFEIVGPTVSSGVGSSTLVVVITRFRSASSSGLSSSSVVSGRLISREALASGQGSSPIGLWMNAGRTLNEGIKLPPFWIDAKPKFVRRR